MPPSDVRKPSFFPFPPVAVIEALPERERIWGPATFEPDVSYGDLDVA